MNKSEFTVIENQKLKDEHKQVLHATNPLAKKFVHFENKEKFSVKDLFKK